PLALSKSVLQDLRGFFDPTALQLLAAQSCRRCQRLRPQLPRRWHSVLIVQPLRREAAGPPGLGATGAAAGRGARSGEIHRWLVGVGLLQRQHEAADPVGVHQRGVQPARQPGAAQRGDRRLRQCGHAERMQSYNLSAEWRRPVLDRYSGGAAGIQRPGDLRRESKLQITAGRDPLRLARTAVVSPESVAAGRAASEATGRQRALDALEAEAERLRAALADIEARKDREGGGAAATGDPLWRWWATPTPARNLFSVRCWPAKSSSAAEDRLFATHPAQQPPHVAACRAALPWPAGWTPSASCPTCPHQPGGSVIRCTLRDSLDGRPAAPRGRLPAIRTGRNGAGQFRTRWTNSDCPRKLRNGMLTSLQYIKCATVCCWTRPSERAWAFPSLLSICPATDSESPQPPAPPEDSLLVSCETGLNLVELQRRLQSRLISGLGYQRVRLRCSPASRLYTWLEQQ
uniref:F-box domain-containing protein n=1 Tax=Macrostomum lignano TaxID=282301 RepID=A0A1I8FDM5_9PLAT